MTSSNDATVDEIKHRVKRPNLKGKRINPFRSVDKLYQSTERIQGIMDWTPKLLL